VEQNILVVEDEEALRMVLGDHLRGEGYMVECAPDAESGFRKATSRPFDLMILDIMLPGRSGLDLCSDIRNAGFGTPILMLTACRETEVKVAGFAAGADDYVTKPFDMLELNARVERLLRRTPTSESSTQTATFPQSSPTQHSAMLESAPAAGQNSLIYPLRPKTTNCERNFTSESAPRKTRRRWSKLFLGCERCSIRNSKLRRHRVGPAFLSVVERVIEFLEEIFEEMRSPKRRR